MTDLLTYEFDKTSIQFLITNDVMVNATHMGLAYKKNPADFLKTKNAIELIEALKRRALGQKKNITEEQIASGIEFLEGENIVYSSNLTPILLTSKSGAHDGVWMHKWLAIEYARFLNIDFQIWVLERIDYLFVSFTQAQRKLVVKENQLVNERRKLIEQNGGNAALVKLASLDDELKDIRNKKSYETRKTYSEWRMQF